MNDNPFVLDEDERAALVALLCDPHVFEIVDANGFQLAGTIARLITRLSITDDLHIGPAWIGVNNVPKWALQMLIDRVGFEPAAQIVKERLEPRARRVKKKPAAARSSAKPGAKAHPQTPATRQKIAAAARKQAKRRRRTPGGAFAKDGMMAPGERVSDERDA